MRILHRQVQLSLAMLLSFGLLVVMTGATLAHSAIPEHAKVLTAVPAIGSTIIQAPTKVTVFTAENINPDPKKSNLFVYSPVGDLISQGDATVSFANPKEMSITIKPDSKNSAGVYIVRWITVSANDGDPDQGAFIFTVNSGAAATPTPVATTSPSQTTPPPATTSGTGGTPVWVSIVVGVLALLIGLGGGLGLGRRRAGSALGAMRKAVGQQSEEQEVSKRP